MADAKYQIKKAVNGQYTFVLRSKGNAEIILRASETYVTKQGCINGINSCQINSPYDRNYVKRLYSFSLLAANSKVIGVSEEYSSVAARDNGIAAVKRDGPTTIIEDLT